MRLEEYGMIGDELMYVTWKKHALVFMADPEEDWSDKALFPHLYKHYLGILLAHVNHGCEIPEGMIVTDRAI